MPTDTDGAPMARSPDWVGQGIDPRVPHAGRIYDYFLDGGHNFAVDRKLGDKIERLIPASRDAARLNRAFLRRAVLFMVDSGIRQFLDIGSSHPMAGNVHAVAQRADPRCRVVYVDKEPVVHSNLRLADNDRATAIRANLRDVEDILAHPHTRRLVDFDQPVGLLMLWVLHFVPDSWDPVGIVARYRDRLAPGSCLAISHITTDGGTPGLDAVLQLYNGTPDPVYTRGHPEILRLFTGFELVEPGLVGSAYWRPSGPGDISTSLDMNSVSYGGLGRKL